MRYIIAGIITIGILHGLGIGFAVLLKVLEWLLIMPWKMIANALCEIFNDI